MKKMTDCELQKKYKMKYDFHTHTVYSTKKHAKGTVEENVLEARKKGLTELAISDHGLGHIFYGIKYSDLPNLRKDIDEVNRKYSDIKVYMSVEANIVNSENGLDMKSEDAKHFDFLIAGYHFGVRGGYCVQNWISNKRHKFSGSLLVKNTDMTLRAIYENDIKILTHPGDKYEIDMLEIAKACAKRRTMMEISSWHKNLTVEQIKQVINQDVKFVISSDAHTPDKVGTFEGGLRRAIEAGLDISRIDNIELISEI